MSTHETTRQHTVANPNRTRNLTVDDLVDAENGAASESGSDQAA